MARANVTRLAHIGVVSASVQAIAQKISATTSSLPRKTMIVVNRHEEIIDELIPLLGINTSGIARARRIKKGNYIFDSPRQNPYIPGRK